MNHPFQGPLSFCIVVLTSQAFDVALTFRSHEVQSNSVKTKTSLPSQDSSVGWKKEDLNGDLCCGPIVTSRQHCSSSPVSIATMVAWGKLVGCFWFLTWAWACISHHSSVYVVHAEQFATPKSPNKAVGADSSLSQLRGRNEQRADLRGEWTAEHRRLPGENALFDGDWSATETGALSGVFFLLLIVCILYCCCGCSLFDICMLWCCWEICCDNGVPFD